MTKHCKSPILQRMLSVCVLSVLLTGCIPGAMQLVKGDAPSYADKDVRFRTTYYFRIYDFCYDIQQGLHTSQPVTDSLYRFTMTGKANALASKTRFESGTLLASQIDPFGATVERDSASGAPRFVSQAEIQARAKRKDTIELIKTLMALDNELSSGSSDPSGQPKSLRQAETNPLALNNLKNTLHSKINNAVNQLNLNSGNLIGANESPNPRNSASIENTQNALNCPPGSAVQRGFQVMGPEGVKTFNQEERLIMAMSSDAKPLIATLEETSGRFLRAEANQLSATDVLLPLVNEQLRVSNLELSVLKYHEADQLDTLYESLTAEFKR